MEQRTEQITSRDGGAFDGYLFEPQHHNGKAILLLHEIFGVVTYVEDVARRLNALGYLVLTPDLFWRLEPRVRLFPPDEQVEPAMQRVSRFDWDLGTADCGSALAHLRALVGSRTGVVGFCFGGTLAFMTAAMHQPDFAISYYGSGVPEAVGRVDEVPCPLLMHFGGSDPFIPEEALNTVRAWAQARPNVEMHVHPGATHAFDNHESRIFHHPEASQRAWQLTEEFLGRHG